MCPFQDEDEEPLFCVFLPVVLRCIDGGVVSGNGVLGTDALGVLTGIFLDDGPRTQKISLF